jgi:hypothetical protein
MPSTSRVPRRMGPTPARWRWLSLPRSSRASWSTSRRFWCRLSCCAPAQVVRVIAQHDHAKAAGRRLAYIPLGAAVVAKRLWDSRNTARYERWLRTAEAAQLCRDAGADRELIPGGSRKVTSASDCRPLAGVRSVNAVLALVEDIAGIGWNEVQDLGGCGPTLCEIASGHVVAREPMTASQREQSRVSSQQWSRMTGTHRTPADIRAWARWRPF